jgi:hypothetical protein
MWREGSLLQPIDGQQYRKLLELQETIGARQFFEGWMHKEWEILQQQYYVNTNSHRSSKWWTIAFITKLWQSHGTFGIFEMLSITNRRTIP